jgi:hypothetical protein
MLKYSSSDGELSRFVFKGTNLIEVTLDSKMNIYQCHANHAMKYGTFFFLQRELVTHF